MQDDSYKDRFLIVDQNLVGIKNRGVLTNNASVGGNPVNFHPMFRDNWGTADPLRGLLGSYYTQYLSTAGPTLYNYASALNTLRAGGNVNAFDQDLSPAGVGALRNQLQGNNYGTNIIFHPQFLPNDADIILTFSPWTWSQYPAADAAQGNGSQWFIDNLVDYIGDFDLSTPPVTVTDLINGNQYSFEGVLNMLNFENKTFLDHTSRHFLLTKSKTIRERSGVLTAVEPFYNFYINSNPDYEDVIADPRVKEYMIPNSYYLLLELRNTTNTPLAPYHVPAVQFGGTYSTFPAIVTAQTPSGPLPWFQTSTAGVSESNIGVYYNLYSDGMAAAIETMAEETNDVIKDVNGDIAVVRSDLPVLDPDSLDLNKIPFYNKLVIGDDTDSSQSAASLLVALAVNPQTADFIDILQAAAVFSYYVQGYLPAQNFATRYKRLNDVNDLSDFTYDSVDVTLPLLLDLGDILTNGLPSVIDFVNFFQNKPTGVLDFIPVKFLRDYFGKTPDILNANPADVALSMNQAMTNMFPNGLPGSLVSTFKRTIQEIFNNKICHTETLMYVVEKYRIDGDNEEMVQRFFISPRIEKPPVTGPLPTYYDSQIKYDTKYRYDIKKMVIVFGSEYTYPRRSLIFPGQTTVIKGVENQMSIKVILAPYAMGSHGLEVIMKDKPPVSPNLSFYPIKGNDRNIKILLHAHTGDYEDRPVLIQDADAAYFEEQYYAQNELNKTFDEISEEGLKITFKSDDPVNKYQLFRISDKPTSYRDFNNEFIEIDPTVGVPGYYQDTIVPNNKYYYCARAVDVHDNVSNPTYIFEIEMINNEGQIFLTQQLFTFEKEKPTYSRTGRRFIYVEPSFNQVALDQTPAAPGDIQDPPPDGLLGASTNIKSCWKETFKIRVTSKKTGKKLDLNLTFKNSGVTNPS
jgi:hypothetical protein